MVASRRSNQPVANSVLASQLNRKAHNSRLPFNAGLWRNLTQSVR